MHAPIVTIHHADEPRRHGLADYVYGAAGLYSLRCTNVVSVSRPLGYVQPMEIRPCRHCGNFRS